MTGGDRDDWQYDTQIFNIDFCGDMGKPLWPQYCSKLGGSCEDYVQNNPDKFKEAYWLVNSVKVFGKGNSTDTTTSESSSASGASETPSSSTLVSAEAESPSPEAESMSQSTPLSSASTPSYC